MLFGAVMVFSCLRFISNGWIYTQYVEPSIHFPYMGFEWVVSLGSPGMEILFAVMTLAALGIALGAFYRVSAVAFFLTFTYVELIDKTFYLNHYYYVSLLALLMCLVPAQAAWSVDRWRTPSRFPTSVPQWTLDVFKLQTGILYVFAGIAKLRVEWLVDAMPMRLWMPASDTVPVIGSLMNIGWMPWAFSWAGMLYDLSIPFLLLYRPTRWWAYATVIVFHITVGLMFPIGVFPLLLIAMTLVFMVPTEMSTPPSTSSPLSVRYSKLAPLLIVFFCIQLLLPFRYLLYPGNMLWTEEGFRFGWRVMLVEKAGTATFTITDRKTGRAGTVDNALFLTDHQERMMSYQPDMILQYAHALHDHFVGKGLSDPRVTADVWVTMNGQPSRQLVDTSVDLSRQTLGFHRNAWVLLHD
jgi:hypothetical protein